MNTLIQQCDAEVRNLTISPSFAMSLGAKELFHTNFLAFILEDRSPSLDKVRISLKNVLGIVQRDDEETYCLVWRESHHFDLIVVPYKKPQSSGAHRATVIEAKLKSTPNLQQLNDYAEQIGLDITLNVPKLKQSQFGPNRVHLVANDVSKTLLSHEHNLDLSGTGWKPVFWSGLVSALESAVLQLGETSLLELLVKDYWNSLLSIQSILHNANNYLDKSSGWYDLIKGIEGFKEIRLHDLLSKYITSQLLVKLKKEIDAELYESFYTNQSAGISFKQSIRDRQGRELWFGIQIQGRDMRRFVESPLRNGVILLDVLPELRPWVLSDGFRGLQGDHEKLGVFGRDRFQYSIKKIEKFSWQDLVSEVKSTMSKEIRI